MDAIQVPGVSLPNFGIEELKQDLLTSPAEVVQVADESHDGIITKEKFAEIGKEATITPILYGFNQPLFRTKITLDESLSLSLGSTSRSYDLPTGVIIDTVENKSVFFQYATVSDNISYPLTIITTHFSKTTIELTPISVYVIRNWSLSSPPSTISVNLLFKKGEIQGWFVMDVNVVWGESESFNGETVYQGTGSTGNITEIRANVDTLPPGEYDVVACGYYNYITLNKVTQFIDPGPFAHILE